jgi:hypothetical protein
MTRQFELKKRKEQSKTNVVIQNCSDCQSSQRLFYVKRWKGPVLAIKHYTVRNVQNHGLIWQRAGDIQFISYKARNPIEMGFLIRNSVVFLQWMLQIIHPNLNSVDTIQAIAHPHRK